MINEWRVTVFATRVRFTLVSDPPEEEDQDADCEDVGVAFVNIRDILTNRKDIVDQDVDSKSVLTTTMFCDVRSLAFVQIQNH